MKNFKLLFISSLLLVAPLTSCGGNELPYRPSGDDNKVLKVELDVNYMKLTEGQTLQLHPTITYKDDQEVSVYTEWRSSKTNVALVSSDGLVTAINSGRTTITFIAGYKSAACTIEVPTSGGDVPVPPTPGEFTIYLNKSSHSMSYGETCQLVATTSEDVDVSWSVTEGGNIVSVDQSGLVTAGQVMGSATVTASAVYEEVTYTASCSFEVSGQGDDPSLMTVRYFFFIDFNNCDEEDETGTKLLASFKWYPDRPVGQSGLVPNDPTVAPTSDFPYFVGWSDHPFVDTKDDLIDVATYESGDTRTYKYIFGIWADVPKGEFIK